MVKKCCTADIPHFVGPFFSLGFLKFQLLALHAAEQPVLWNKGNLLSLHYFLWFCSFHPHSKCSMHCLLSLGLNSVVRQSSGLKVTLLLSAEWTKFNSWLILWQFSENLLDEMHLWAEDFEKCAPFQHYRQQDLCCVEMEDTLSLSMLQTDLNSIAAGLCQGQLGAVEYMGDTEGCVELLLIPLISAQEYLVRVLWLRAPFETALTPKTLQKFCCTKYPHRTKTAAQNWMVCPFLPLSQE